MKINSAFGALLSAAALTLTLATPVHAYPVPGQGTWETTLQARDLDGNGVTDAFYDTILDITWLRDADVNGAKHWDDANTWAAGYSIGGYSGWRLPTMIGTAGALGCVAVANGGTDCGYNVDPFTSEMAHLFFNTLGNKSAYKTNGEEQHPYGLMNSGDFLNMKEAPNWLGLSGSGTDSDQAWIFIPSNGAQWLYSKNDRGTAYAMAVHNGDLLAAPVPEPETYAMMLAGLSLLGVMTRRRKQKAVA